MAKWLPHFGREKKKSTDRKMFLHNLAQIISAAVPVPACPDRIPKAISMTRVGNQTNSSDPHAVNSRIFVGNLNTYVVSKEDVERIFTRYGRIIGISMHKGYAFVQYTDTWDARNAVVGEDGRTVAGQVLDVNMVSEPKPHQVNRKRQIIVGSSGSTFLGLRQAVPPLKRPRTDVLGFPVTPRPKSKPPKLTEKQQASLNSLYSNGEPDILICGNCKEVFPGIHKLIEHKKQSCKLRFTCRCQHTSSPPGAPAKPVCARCQSKQNTWWDLVQHVQTAHGTNIYQWDETSNSADSPIGEDSFQPQSGELTTCSSLVQDLKEESSCSDSQSGMPDWDTLEVNNGAGEDDGEEAEETAMQQTETMNHIQEDKAVDTADLGIPVGQG